MVWMQDATESKNARAQTDSSDDEPKIQILLWKQCVQEQPYLLKKSAARIFHAIQAALKSKFSDAADRSRDAGGVCS